MLQRANLQVAPLLAEFIEARALPGTGIHAEAFWRGVGAIFESFAPRNRALLATRDRLQAQLDDWHRAHTGQDIDQAEYQSFLREIGYLVAEPDPFAIDPGNIDAEIATVAGAQLVVPMLNARFLLNAANARWDSLYDALYGSDAIPGAAEGPSYDAARGAQVVDWGRDFLDTAAPLADGSWGDWDGALPILADPAQLVGRSGDNYLLRHHGLHIEIVIDRDHPIGRSDAARVADIVLESALSTICDLEDSVAAVDAADKVAGYANWLGLIRGDLTASFAKNGKTVDRRLAPDRDYVDPAGNAFTLPGRALLLVRNVGHLMTTPAVILADGGEAPEGILDAIVTGLIGLHDVRGLGQHRNSRAGSIYIVKPKMHGAEECAFSNDLFDAVEDLLGLARHSIKIGVMDEERRTSANLAACLAAVRHRIFFVNTGFLDRTGDDIHSAMEAGAMLRKGDMKLAPWITAYEDRNVQIALAAGFSGRAQIGKGMWAAPDRMAEMLATKIGHPQAGANTAWVPSPTAATLHATHYHRLDVFARQSERAAEPVASLDDLLTVPLARGVNWSDDEIRAELNNNTQSLLGYVVRWIQQGIGCSTVPDIADVGLMEDRATLRISSQHIANWLRHGIVTADDVDGALERMAAHVDAQNAADPNYRAMAGRGTDSIAFSAARALIFEGAVQPNGYTEPLLHSYRQQAKAQG